ncbi:hypothetical protein DICVIV_03198 [Dictyocaulus viviparus]|uniref:Proteolipid membrane potential modulator n=1 Tax=Dictyocaulus viviparus TaxID=29172 RepID=A0A0D8Y1H0_DICVI|nr:hypothetical protein DICVIV_03198 [Dictyocaulus viviparus]
MCCRPCQFICAFFIPPLAVMCHSGCTGSFFINVVLTLLGFLPGVVHAIYVICTQKSQDKAIRMTTNVCYTFSSKYLFRKQVIRLSNLIHITSNFVCQPRKIQHPLNK